MGVVGKVGEAPAGALTTPLSSAEGMSSEFMGAVEAHGLVVRLSRMYLTKPLQDWRCASWRFDNTASSAEDMSSEFIGGVGQVGEAPAGALTTPRVKPKI
jgi:hypothetical protein